MVLINLIFVSIVAAAVAHLPGAASDKSPASTSIPDFERNSNITKTGFHCDCQWPDDAKLRVFSHPVPATELYDAIVNQPGIFGFKVPYTPVRVTDPALHYWTMEWIPKDTTYKSITIRWGLNDKKFVFLLDVFSTVVRSTSLE